MQNTINSGLDPVINRYPFSNFWIPSDNNSVGNINYWLRCLEKAFEGKIKSKSDLQSGSELEKMVIRIHFLLLWKKMFHFTNSWTKRFEEIVPHAGRFDTLHTLDNYSKDYLSTSLFPVQIPLSNGGNYQEIQIQSKWIKNWSETAEEYGLEETAEEYGLEETAEEYGLEETASGFLIIIRKLLDLYYPRDSKDIKLTIVSEISENRVFKKSTLI